MAQEPKCCWHCTCYLSVSLRLLSRKEQGSRSCSLSSWQIRPGCRDGVEGWDPRSSTHWSILGRCLSAVCVGGQLEEGLGRLEAENQGLNMDSDNMLSRRHIWDPLKSEDFLRYREKEEEKTKSSRMMTGISNELGAGGRGLGQGDNGCCLGMLDMRAVWLWHLAPHWSPRCWPMWHFLGVTFSLRHHEAMKYTWNLEDHSKQYGFGGYLLGSPESNWD